VMLIITGMKLIWDAAIFRHLLSRRMTSLKRSAILMTNDLSSFALARFAAGLLGGILMPAFLLSRIDDAMTQFSGSRTRSVALRRKRWNCVRLSVKPRPSAIFWNPISPAIARPLRAKISTRHLPKHASFREP